MRKAAIQHFLALLKTFDLVPNQAQAIDVGGTRKVYFEGEFIDNPLGKIFTDIRYLEEGFSSRRINTTAHTVADFLDPQTITPLQNQFDFVLSFDTLEHIKDPFLFCEHLLAVTKPGGYIAISTVFEWPYHPAPEDYFRFSPTGLREVFTNTRNSLGEDLSVLHVDWDSDNKGVFLLGRRLPKSVSSLSTSGPNLNALCAQLEAQLPRTTQTVLAPFDLLQGHPWAHHASSSVSNYYGCLYGLIEAFTPTRILEIGTAFGLSGATMLAAAPRVDRFVTMDLGIYGRQLAMDQDNMDFAQEKIHAWCRTHSVPPEVVHFFTVNTQPEGETDNDGEAATAPHWQTVQELMDLLQPHSFDVAFVDGKHTGNGLYNDLCSFWQYVRPGGLVICDDLHDQAEYGGHFLWAGQTLDAFHRFVDSHADAIGQWRIWNFPRVLPEGKYGLRPFGLIKKQS